MTTQSPAAELGTRPQTDSPPRLPARAEPRLLVRHPVAWIALAAALLRLPYLKAPMSPDEGGFMIVAQHWHAGGGSLYGPYWVDRPPLLIAFFRLADLLGGFTALRLLGCVVVALTVIGVGMAATACTDTPEQARRASAWSAAVAAALLVAPTGGGLMVNGELLATPFTAFGVALAIRAVRGTSGRVGPDVAAVGAGVCAAAAVMVKQNMVDVGVFALVLGVAAVLRHRAEARALGRRALLAVAGGVGTLVVVLGGAWILGTTPWGVFYAMYPFRLQASEAMQAVPSPDRAAHVQYMLQMWGATGAPLVIAAFLAVLLLRRRAPGGLSGPVVVALLVLATYDVVSIALGGSYWTHYMLQLVVPVALMAGVVLARTPWLGRGVVVVVLIACSAGYAIGTTVRVPDAGVAVGGAVQHAAQPGDTVLSMLGDGALVRRSGLAAPYPYLWSLPAHVLDHRFSRLTAMLESPRGPSWVIVRGTEPTRVMQRLGPGDALKKHYRMVSYLCGRQVYLRDDLTRAVPRATDKCSLPLAPWNVDSATRRWVDTEGSTR